MTNDDAIKIALKNELISDIEAYQTLPKYKISLKFDKKMKHLLKNYENRESAKTGYKRIPLKNRLLIAAVIILSVAIITAVLCISPCVGLTSRSRNMTFLRCFLSQMPNIIL